MKVFVEKIYSTKSVRERNRDSNGKSAKGAMKSCHLFTHFTSMRVRTQRAVVNSITLH